MAISEAKMQMVIANYFKDECDVNTSIRQAFEKGFRIGVKKGASTNRPQGRNLSEEYPSLFECSVCGASCDDTYPWDCDIKFCPNCGADMREREDE